jgi:membrane-bound lytic murein transglycosylase B
MRTIFWWFAATACFAWSINCHAGDFSQREDVQAFIRDLAQRQHFRVEDLQAAFNAAREVPQVIKLIKPSTDPNVRSWQRYRPQFINSVRISAGVDFWHWHERALTMAEARTGVPAEIIVGIIGVETIYGRNTGNFQTLSALATLAFDYPPRADLFRKELEELFLLARDQGQDVREYRGSYAGAIGLPQFLPSKIRSLGMDGDGDGHIDIRGNADDAIASVASYLASYGWQRDGRIVMPARVDDPIRAQSLIDAGIAPVLDGAILQQAGVHSDLKPQEHDLVTLVDLVSPGSPTEYWLGFQNFYVITRYNHSSFYAMSVNDLGHAVKLAYESQRDLVNGDATPAPTPKAEAKKAVAHGKADKGKKAAPKGHAVKTKAAAKKGKTPSHKKHDK